MGDLPAARFIANCSLLFAELPLHQRPAAAKSAGFEAIEFWWPFAEPVPGDREVDEFVSAISDAGIWLAGLNFYAGDLAGDDCGALSVPALSGRFADSVDVAVSIGRELGVNVFNALYGIRVPSVAPAEQDELALVNLAYCSQAASGIGASVLIEAVSGPKPYPIRTAAQVQAVIDRAQAAGLENVGMLLDIYHLAANGDDVGEAIRRHGEGIRHVQIADYPGRGEPGSAGLDIAGYLHALQTVGYEGLVGLEYRPTVTTVDSLRWLPVQMRGVGVMREPGGRR